MRVLQQNNKITNYKRNHNIYCNNYININLHNYLNMLNEFVIAYFAISISILGRFIFMYLLYTNKSTNPYSLIFSIMNMISSSLWIVYSQIKSDTPLLVRGLTDFILFSISTAYIIFNRLKINKIQQEPV